MALPLMLGQSVVMLNEQFMRIFGSMAGDGAVSLLSYARRISQVPVGIIGQAMAVASYPFLASLAAKKDFKTLNQTLHSAISSSTILLLPLSAWMIAAAVPCMGFIFEGGDFSTNDTILSAPLLQIMLLMVPFWGIQMVLGRAFYALGDTLTPAICGTIITIISLPIFYYALYWGAMGIAVVSFWGVVIYVIAIVFIWKKRQGNSAFEGLGKILLFGLFLCFTNGLLAWYVGESILRYTQFLPSIWPYAISLLGSFTIFSLSYTFCTYKLCPELVQPIFIYYKKLKKVSF